MDHSMRVTDAVNRAQHLGTLGAVDRSAQYQDPDSREQLRWLNEAWSKIRCLQGGIGLRDKKIMELEDKVQRYRWGTIIMTALITGITHEICRALAPHFVIFSH
jgi:hypothetical protein